MLELDRRRFIKAVSLGAVTNFSVPDLVKKGIGPLRSIVEEKDNQALFDQLQTYNLSWNTQSKNSSESMPCGGGDIGLNVWVESNDLLFYLSRSGAFDENNRFPKLGRVRLRLSPNPFEGATEFRQELKLEEGCVEIAGKSEGLRAEVKIWVDVRNPVVNVEILSNREISVDAFYENWRIQDRPLSPAEGNATSYKTTPASALPKGVVMEYKDEITFDENRVLFYHRNRNDDSVFDFTVRQQGLEAIKEQLWNPLKNLTFGGAMFGQGFRPAGQSAGAYANTPFAAWRLEGKAAKKHHLILSLHIAQTDTLEQWKDGLNKTLRKSRSEQTTALARTKVWWKNYWERSHVFIDASSPASVPWQVGRNYQLFRYMLGCNAYGQYPTKFNGGLFTFDPVWVNEETDFSPDFRRWGGGTFTAQNQRLLYWPMLKSGDFDMMSSEFEFYLRALPNAELRSHHYWNHNGACFTEQLQNFGLPDAFEYNADTFIFKKTRPPELDPGIQFNDWIQHTWDTVFEFCLMILYLEKFTGQDISRYIPLVESTLRFFDEHYQQEHKKQSSKPLDGDGHLVLYPGSSAETYKGAYNASTTIAALQAVLEALLKLPDDYLDTEKRKHWQEMRARVPPLPFREMQGHKTLAPAEVWDRLNNQEIPQLYSVFPYGQYGVGRPDLDVAVDTWKYDTEVAPFKSHVGWKQDAIFCARLGLTDEAAAITLEKMRDAKSRFPVFWGPGFDWTPDHNWGGSGMIGVQEMLLQTVEDRIYLFPAWPKNWDVRFKLHAPLNTTVEAELKNGVLILLTVLPEARRNDLTNLLK